MLFLLPLFAPSPLAPNPATIVRDPYGVPTVSAEASADMFYGQGYAVAEDRMWQLEMSRRVARGRISEVTGAADASADAETLRQGYSEAELQTQFDHLSPLGRTAYQRFADGVNAYLTDHQNDLPEGYARLGFRPEPWTPLDSVAITVRLMQQFGRGGAGELRNLTLIEYLRTRPQTKDRILDVLDDLAPLNPKGSPSTLPFGRPPYPLPDRKASERQLAALPRFSLLELAPAARIASREASDLVAERVAAPYHTGSYAIVVGRSRSATGYPLLLSAPQMGFRRPSIVHEMTLRSAGINVSGIDVPGIPGVVIGRTATIAWGLTSGIADTDDIGIVRPNTLPVTTREIPYNVKGVGGRKVVAERTAMGPVLLATRDGNRFVRQSTYWMRELESWDALAGVWTARNVRQADRSISRATMSFNFFCADGRDIAYRYVGLVPKRPADYDPRFPRVLSATDKPLPLIPADDMPHAVNPPGDLLTNWNNRPTPNWPNGDTPAFLALNRVAALNRAIPRGRLRPEDLIVAAHSISLDAPSWPYFRRYLPQLREFDGKMVAGSLPAGVYERLLDELRLSLFEPVTGTFLSMDNLRLIAQPGVVLDALAGRTKVDYRAGRSITKIVAEAYAKAVKGPEYVPDQINSTQPPVLYANRGTYIQVVELGPGTPRARTVLPPGNAERGTHTDDQAPLSREWNFKPIPPLTPRPR